MTRAEVAADVGFFDDGDRVYAARLPRGPIIVLADAAADAWRSAIGTTPATDATPATVEHANGQASEEDAARYLHAMVEARLLTLEDG